MNQELDHKYFENDKYLIRKLELTDYDKGYFELLN